MYIFKRLKKYNLLSVKLADEEHTTKYQSTLKQILSQRSYDSLSSKTVNQTKCKAGITADKKLNG